MAGEEREEPEATTVADDAPEEVKESSPPPPPAAPSDGVKMSGTVNWFNVAKGFGAFQFRVSFVSRDRNRRRARARVSPPAAFKTRGDANRLELAGNAHRAFFRDIAARRRDVSARARPRSFFARSARSTSPRKPATRLSSF
jgi:hypothetical protein